MRTAPSLSSAPAVPADAAGLVLLRRTGRGPEVLMGRRSAKMRFMPGYYVFPGGRVDATDYQSSGFAEALAPQPRGLDWPSHHKLVALARAALRETFEETGLLVGPSGRPRRRPSGGDIWRAFQDSGRCPAFDQLRLFARAVTPVSSPVRFNTRFFLAQDCTTGGMIQGNGELEDLGWQAVSAVAKLPLATVTSLVLQEALLHDRRSRQRRRRAPLMLWIRPKIGRRYSLAGAAAARAEPA